ncbi:cell division protein FtsA, partial [mine drainage metagenome]
RLAGDQVTNDIAVSMRTPDAACRGHQDPLRVRALAARQPRRDHRGAERGRPSGPRLARQTLAEVVEPRYEELFGLVREELRRSGFEELVVAGVVLTGGSARMEGVIELAEEVFHLPVRLGLPQQIQGLADVVRNPIYATGVGLLLYARDNLLPARRARARGGNAKATINRMRAWFQGNF